MERARVALFLVAGLFLTWTEALPQMGPVAEFWFGSNALVRSKIFASFTAAGNKNIGFIFVDGISDSPLVTGGIDCVGNAGWLPTTPVEMAERTKENINTGAAYSGSVLGGQSKYVANLASDLNAASGSAGATSTVCNRGRSSPITAWNVFCYNCAPPYSSPSVVLQTVGSGDACIPPYLPPPIPILPGPKEIIRPLVTADPPRLEFRGRPVLGKAVVRVQATALPGTTGPLLTIEIPQNTPLDLDGVFPNDIGSIVTKALNDNQYIATNLRLLQPFWTTDPNERSLFVEIKEVKEKKADLVNLFIYDSFTAPGLELADPHDPIGYGVTFINVEDTGGDPPIYENIMVFPTPEAAWGADLNGDGDLDDQILRFKDLQTGEVVDTHVAVSGRSRQIDIYEKTVVFAGEGDEIGDYDIATGATEFLGIAGSHPTIYGKRIAFESGGTIWHFDLETKILVNTGAPGQAPSIYGDLIAFHGNVSSVPTTIRYYDIQTGEVTDTGAAGLEPALYKSIIAFTTSESQIQADLNGDGDKDDSVIRYYDLAAGTTVSTSAAGSSPMIHGNRIVFSTSEVKENKDLNGDGHIRGSVIQYYDLQASQVINTRAQGTEPDIYGNTLTYYLWEDWAFQDLNGDGDTTDPIVRTVDLPASPEFIRGDCNQDLRADVSDAVASLSFSFGGTPLACVEACDVNSSGRVDISDPISLLRHLFLGSPAPPLPFPTCGTAQGTLSLLGCDAPACKG